MYILVQVNYRSHYAYISHDKARTRTSTRRYVLLGGAVSDSEPKLERKANFNSERSKAFEKVGQESNAQRVLNDL